MTEQELLKLEEGSVIGRNKKKYVVVYVDSILGVGIKYGIIRIYHNCNPIIRFVREVFVEDIEENYKLIKP